MNNEPKSYSDGVEAGREAVRQKPTTAPRNPFSEDNEPDAFNGWNDGAIEAGIGEIYTNGVLDSQHR